MSYVLQRDSLMNPGLKYLLMKEITITTIIRQCRPDELPSETRQLAKKAIEMAEHAYAPYSGFQVGAAILLSNGKVVGGSNQENAAFPSGMCAERTACYQAGALYPDAAFRRIVIAAGKRNKEGVFELTPQPISPCGACRQALLEYETKGAGPVEVVLYGAETCYVFPSVASLLPYAFTDF